MYWFYYNLYCILFLFCYFINVVGFFDNNDDDDDDDDGFQLMISIVVLFRVFIVKSRVLSVRLIFFNRWFGIVGFLKLCFFVLLKKINVWVLVGDEK